MMETDSATGSTFDLVGELAKKYGAEDSSGLRRAFVYRLAQPNREACRGLIPGVTDEEIDRLREDAIKELGEPPEDLVNGKVHVLGGTKRNFPYLSVETDKTVPANAKLVMRDLNDTPHDIHNLDDFNRVMGELESTGWDLSLGFLCSSSVDFPDEYTDDEAFIALCEEIRSE